MAVFSKRSGASAQSDGADDYVRIPAGTRIATGEDGKLMMSFAGDMSFGEALPELSELNCGRNLSIDAGVTIRADIVRVKATLDLDAGARLVANELEVDRVESRKGQIEARTINAGQIELEGSKVVADRVTSRENVVIDRGEVEIGTIVAQSLTIAKGTTANILITEVAKMEGSITKGGYENFAEFLGKVLLYHPEILNDRFGAEARRTATSGVDTTGVAEPLTPVSVLAPTGTSEETDGDSDPRIQSRLAQEGQRLRSFYQDREVPSELSELLGYIDAQRVPEIRKRLTPIYQRLAPQQGKLPELVVDVFREVQKILREDPSLRKEARPA